MFEVFSEKPDRISDFLLAKNRGFLGLDSVAEQKSTSGNIPQLSYLRVELDRLRPGMSDYIVRVSSPLYEGVEKTNTVLSIRGSRNLAKYEFVKKLADVVCREMLEREDSTFDWEHCDAEHLADMMATYFKFFSITTNADRLQFTTEALA